jgi:hypothetical protein
MEMQFYTGHMKVKPEFADIRGECCDICGFFGGILRRLHSIKKVVLIETRANATCIG